jgi:diaminopimelate decarboxylase
VVKSAILSALNWQDQRRRRHLGMVERDLPPHLWDAGVSTEGHLVIGGYDTDSLAAEFGTPLQVVDRERLKRNYLHFLEAFRRHYPHVEIGYSYKTNPLPGVLRALHEFGAWAEVISHFELWLALKLGVPPERIVFNGPGKTSAALELAVTRGVKLINIDNLSEPDAIHRFAVVVGRPQAVGVRVITSVGWSSQFGLSIASGAARAAFEKIRQLDHLVPCGLHVHLGTGIRDLAIYLRAIIEAFEFAKSLERELSIRIRFFDFGGGFGVPTVRPFTEWDHRMMAAGYRPFATDVSAAAPIQEYGRRIIGLLKSYYPNAEEEGLTVFLEPGRAITSSAQTLLLRVLAVKDGPGSVKNVILDGGKNIAMPTGYEYHEVFAASRLLQTHDTKCNLFGPLCHPADVIALTKRLPALEAGDLIAIMDAGAYFVPNQMNFSHTRPAAVMVEQGSATLIRERESYENIVALDRLASPLEESKAEAVVALGDAGTQQLSRAI